MTTAPRTWLFCDYNQAESRVVAWRGPVPKLRQWYSEGKDVHLLVTKIIAKVIQENKIKLYGDIFIRKHWDEFIKGDEEREQCKRIVHGYNYEVGVGKVALILGVQEIVAKTLMTIYGTLFPEIKTGYQAWIRQQIQKSKTLWMPEPVKFRKVFWDIITDDLYRQAYASYPQIVVAAMLNRTLKYCSEIFREDQDEKLKEQWEAWYGEENWNEWRSLRDRRSKSPKAILWGGMDIRLNVHDAGGISIPSDSDLIKWAVGVWKAKAEETIWVEKDNPLVIPVDFKVGPTWGDLHDLKLAS